MNALTIIESFAKTGASPIAVLAMGFPDGVWGVEFAVFDGFDSSFGVELFELVCCVSVVFLIFGILIGNCADAMPTVVTIKTQDNEIRFVKRLISPPVNSCGKRSAFVS